MKISIIVPVYNAEKYLDSCIESILSQTYKDYELILVDDGSSDLSPKICDELASKDKRIKVIHQKNSGVSVARNIGIENSVGEYVMFVDSDDFIAPTLCENLFNAISENIDLVISGYVRDYGDKKIKNIVNSTILCDTGELRKNYDRYPLMNTPCAKLYKKSIIDTIRFDKEISMGEDLIFNLKYYAKCKKIIFLPIAEYYYNLTNEKSLTHRYQEKYFFCQKQCYIETKKFRYGEIRFTNDVTDRALCSNGIDDIQSICYLEKDRIAKKKKIQSIIEDGLFQSVCKGKYSFSLKHKVSQKFCQRKRYNLLITFFGIVKFVRRFKLNKKRNNALK